MRGIVLPPQFQAWLADDYNATGSTVSRFFANSIVGEAGTKF